MAEEPRLRQRGSVYPEMEAVSHSYRGAAWDGDPVLLDVTRLVALRWVSRPPNGIDRVCLEYLNHFRERARAVVQHRGTIRALSATASNRLFEDLADERGTGVRTKLFAHLAHALAGPVRPEPGSLYLNVSHTDYDLLAHARWVERHGLRSIYLIHDLIPILHPEHCRPHAVARHTARVAAALRLASGIIVGSAAVASDLSDHADRLRLPPPPVAVAPLAGARPLRNAQPAKAPDVYFLCVGTIESRKNHVLLLKVWERLRERLGSLTPRLIIVGRWASGVAELRKALDASGMVGNLIEVVPDCADDALATLIVGAQAVLMPSLAEGFGLPMAEALALGVPVIASDLPCFREVGQGIPCLLDPNDVSAWEARILAFDPAAARRQRHIDAMVGYRPTSWDGHFERIKPWIARIAAQPVRLRPSAYERPEAHPPVDAGNHLDLRTQLQCRSK